MKVALCLSGHIRNLDQNYPNLKQYILDPYKPDIFLDTWLTYGWRAEGNDIKLGSQEFKGFDHYSGEVNRQQVLDLLQPKKYRFENFLDKESEFVEQANKHRPNCGHPKDRPENTVAMAYKLFNCNDLKKQYEQENNFIYDVVIRSRPDMVYGSSPLVPQALQSIFNGRLFVADAHAYGTASDIFAVGTSETINIYSDLYHHLDAINDAGCNMNPHHVLKFYFDLCFGSNWNLHPFSIALNRCRKQCGNRIECGDCDPNKKILSNIF